MSKVLITGSAGFIGFHLSKLLLENGNKVIGIDCLTNYYDINLKYARLKILKKYKNFFEEKINIIDQKDLLEIFSKYDILWTTRNR